MTVLAQTSHNAPPSLWPRAIDPSIIWLQMKQTPTIGFTDPTHMINDFRAQIGKSPMTFFRMRALDQLCEVNTLLSASGFFYFVLIRNASCRQR
jgi:hypothetical protein